MRVRYRSSGCNACDGADEVECSNFLDAVMEMCRAPDGVFVASRLHVLLRPDTQRLLKHGVSHPDAQVAATTLRLLALLLGSGEAVSILAEGALVEGFLRDLLLECALQRAARGNPRTVRQAALELACVALHEDQLQRRKGRGAARQWCCHLLGPRDAHLNAEGTQVAHVACKLRGEEAAAARAKGKERC